MLPGVVRYAFIIFGLFAKPNLCPLTQNSGDATGVRDVDVSLDSSLRIIIIIIMFIKQKGLTTTHIA